MLGLERRSTHFDISLALGAAGDGLAGSIDYASDLFDAATVQRWAGYWLNLLQAISCKIGTRDLSPADTDLMHRPGPHIRGCTLQTMGLEAEPLRVACCCSIAQFVEEAIGVGKELLRKADNEIPPAQLLQFEEKGFVYDGRRRIR